MAGCGSNFIRVRISFDYPPPAAFGHRMCWLLVDMNACRVVADLESMIREKFDLSRGSILSLFIEDYYLPHTESVHVVRDNDNVRVKVDWLTEANGQSNCTDSSNVKRRKRKTVTEDGQGGSEVCLDNKRKKTSEKSIEEGAKCVLDKNTNKKLLEKHTKKKKENNVEKTCSPLSPKPAAASKNISPSVDQKSKSSKKASKSLAATQNASCKTSSRSLNGQEDFTQKRATETTISYASNMRPHSTPAQIKSSSSSSPSSSSETNGFSEESTRLKPQSLPPPKSHLKSLPTTVLQGQAGGIKRSSQNHEAEPSDRECKGMVCGPMQQPRRGDGSQASWQGNIGRKFGHVSGKRELGKGRRIDQGPTGSFESSCNGANELPHETESQSSTSVIIENNAKSTSQQDYSSMPLLAAPPPIGKTIAFKLLELTENYTPEVSEYKEGKIISFDPITKQIELEVSNAFQAPIEPGKFDLVYQNPDGSDRVEYAVSRDSKVIERWETLLEPRLII